MIKSLFFPSSCVFCSSSASCVCDNCFNKFFDKLQLQLTKPVNSNLEYHLHLVDYDNLYKKFIHNGKYRFNKEVWSIIGKVLSSKIKLREKSFVTFVPLHWIRYCYRGFNQAQLIAEQFGSTKKLLRRKENNVSFTNMNIDQRREKAKELFEVIDRDLYGYFNCYLVDDVSTTGATLEACATLIKEKYRHVQVIGISFAKTPKHSQFMVG